MNLGQAAGLAASMAIKDNRSVQGISVKSLRNKLLEQKAVLELPELANIPRSAKLPGIIMDDQDAERIGHWMASSYGTPVDGASRHDENGEKGKKSVVYRLKVPTHGSYEVRISYAAAGNRASNVPVSVLYMGGEKTVKVNQKKEPEIEGLFTSLGVFEFSADQPAIITISNEETDGIVGADSVQLLKK